MITIEKFGKDHWSVLAYIETLAVDGHKSIDRERMRCNANAHPLVLGRRQAHFPKYKTYPYPTKLRGDETQAEHDDWDCIDDLDAARLVKIVSLVNGMVDMTDRGLEVAHQLRVHKAKGGSFATFEVTL